MASPLSYILDLLGVKKLYVSGSAQTYRNGLDLVAGSGVTLTPADDAAADTLRVTVAASGGYGASFEPVPLSVSRGRVILAASVADPAAAHYICPVFAPPNQALVFSGVEVWIAEYISSTGSLGVNLYRPQASVSNVYDLDEAVTMVNINSSSMVGPMQFMFSAPKTIAAGARAYIDVLGNGTNGAGASGFSLAGHGATQGTLLPGLGGLANAPNKAANPITANSSASLTPWFRLIPP